MKFVAISDTHGCHRQLNLPEGDVLLHAGDVCDQGKKEQIIDFIEWIGNLDFKYKIFLRGNHDIELKTRHSLIDMEIPDGVHYLDHSGIDIDGISIFGVSHPLRWSLKDWETIPKGTDILLTHQPPHGILDQPPTPFIKHLGDEDLLKKVKTINPKVHLFGHIHASYGQEKIGSTLFLNASGYKASKGKIINAPFIFEL